MKANKIVLVGGPCGGKTVSIKFIKQKLNENGYSVKTVEETATSLLKLGYAPNENISLFDFQNLLLKIQFLNEYMYEDMFDIILCDRGIFDGKIYIGENEFEKLLKINRLDEQNIFSTYDGALYFRSIAYEYPKLFKIKRSYENPEIGQRRDELSRDVWLKKIVPCEYNNLDGLENKQKVIYQSLKEKLMELKKDNRVNLSDYYDNKHINFMREGIEEIMDNVGVNERVKIKTMSLVR